MIIKFLSNGTGDPRLAASYLIGEHDHLGNKRAGVEIVRGDPVVFAAIASSLNFKYCYTSIVINWSPEDDVSDEHINEVTDLVEEHAMAGFSSEQYHMTVVMHTDDDGSRHLHILIPRVELTTGKSMNVAPPGHRHYFDPLRDFLNHKYGWARPDDPARMKTTKPKHHHVLQNAAAVKAGIQEQPKKTRVEMIDAFIEQRIMFGRINNRDELVKSLKEIGKIGQVAHKSISLKYKNTRDRLEGAFYRAGFSFSAYRENRTRRTGIQSISAKPQDGSAEYSERLTELFERMETVRRKRTEYNQKYYRPKVSQNEATAGQAAEISYVPRTTVSADLSRETDDRHRVNSIPNKNGDAVSRFDEINAKPAESVKAAPRRDFGNTATHSAESGSLPVRKSRVQEQPHTNDGVTQTNEQSSPESGDKPEQTQNSVHESTRRDSRSTGEDTATTTHNYMGSWDIRRIQYPLTNQKYDLNIGVTHERNTAANSKKSIDHTTTAIDSSIRATSEDRAGEEFESATDHRFPDSINQRTREISEATEGLSRTYAQRKLALEQEAQRYEYEVSRERQDDQNLSRRNQKRDFLDRANRFFRCVKDKIRETFKAVINSLIFETSDTARDRDHFEAISKRIEAVGIDRLVNIARQRTERRQRIENAKRFKQDLECAKEFSNQKLALNTMSAELSHIKESFPHLELKPALGLVATAERCFHQFRDADKSDKDMDLYIGEYVYSIDECFKLLGKMLNIMKPEELDAMKGLPTVIESHLNQIKFETLTENGVVYYTSATKEVTHLVAQFRSELTLQGMALGDKAEKAMEMSYSDEKSRNSEPDRRSGSDYDTFSC